MGVEDHTIEGICDDEDREVAPTELQRGDEFAEDLTRLITTEDRLGGESYEVLWAVATLARLILEEEDKATIPVVEGLPLCDDVLQSMVRRLFASTEYAEDVVATTRGGKDRLLLLLRGDELLRLRQILSLSEVGEAVLCIEATEHCHCCRISTHDELFVRRLTWADIKGTHIHQHAPTSQT